MQIRRGWSRNGPPAAGWLALAGMLLGMAAVPAGAARAAEVYDGITFTVEPGVLYLPVREVGEGLGWEVRWNADAGEALMDGDRLEGVRTRRLMDGTVLVAVRDLEERGAAIGWDADRNLAVLERNGRTMHVAARDKRVVINRAGQRMRAWQGDRLVLDTQVSTGRRGQSTPLGSFTAGPYRARMHYSSLYDNAPMPYSVQVQGNIFIHGFHEVPAFAASAGCIRVPLANGNPAKWFFEWIDNGTPIRISDGW
jgi:hypothetical protein